MEGFGHLCGLSNVHNAIDGIHIQNFKPKTIFLEDYYYHKIKGYSILVQAIVNSLKNKILTFCVGLLGSTNDPRVLHMSALYRHAQN